MCVVSHVCRVLTASFLVLYLFSHFVLSLLTLTLSFSTFFFDTQWRRRRQVSRLYLCWRSFVLIFRLVRVAVYRVCAHIYSGRMSYFADVIASLPPMSWGDIWDRFIFRMKGGIPQYVHRRRADSADSSASNGQYVHRLRADSAASTTSGSSSSNSSTPERGSDGSTPPSPDADAEKAASQGEAAAQGANEEASDVCQSTPLLRQRRGRGS